MESDWTVACGADDPWIVVPWASEDGSMQYIDLRANPDRVGEIPEAVQYPALLAKLLEWNHFDSPIYTAKSDVWSYTGEEFYAEDLPGFGYAQGCYVDLVSRELECFSSFAACEQKLRAWTGVARGIPLENARCEWMLRRARILPAGGEGSTSSVCDGFAITLYVWGYGATLAAATFSWSDALATLNFIS